MTKIETEQSIQELVNHIVEGIKEKKGLDIVSLDLDKIHSTVCDRFIICHGTSNTHAGAIADSVEENVKKYLGINPGRREGYSNAEWILLDYLDVVVHIFQENVRSYYQLEELWADAPITKIKGE